METKCHKLFFLTITILLFSLTVACNNNNNTDSSGAKNNDKSSEYVFLEGDALLEKLDIEAAEQKVRSLYSTNRRFPICDFDTPSEMPPHFLAIYISALHGEHKPIEPEDSSHTAPHYFDYDQIKLILKEEFELDEIPYDVTNKENLRVSWVTGVVLEGGISKLKSVCKDGLIIIDLVVTQPSAEWSAYEQEYFNNTEKLEKAPVVSIKMRYTFKQREGKSPMLIKSEYLG